MASISHDPPGAPEVEHTAGRTLAVGLILALVVTATLAMVGFIWYRWHGVAEPTTAVIVEGDAGLDGTTITVRGMSREITAALTPDNHFVAPVLLVPGNYMVTAERGGQLILRKEVEVKRFLGVRFNLTEYVRVAQAEGRLPEVLPAPRTPPATAPARRSATR